MQKRKAGPHVSSHFGRPTFVDLDDDGWLDLAITGDFGSSVIFFNRGGVFAAEASAEAGTGREENGMGSTFADVDCDGMLDWSDHS